MANEAAIKRGFHWDEANQNLDVYVEGTKVCSFHKTNGTVVVVDAFDLSGQTITAVSGGSADYTTMIAAYNAGAGAADEGAAFMIKVKVGGTAAYIPAFTSV